MPSVLYQKIIQLLGGEKEVYEVRLSPEELDEIDRTIDKMPAIDLGTPTDGTKWLYNDYYYKENGEFDYVSTNGNSVWYASSGKYLERL